jgi:hypothetical protein
LCGIAQSAEGKKSMVESLKPEQIQDILERGNFDKFIGVVEDFTTGQFS